MILITCVEKNNGMLFNNRRVSRDRKLVEDILKYVGNNEILITDFSEELFMSYENVRVVNVIEKRNGQFFFLENVQPSTIENEIEKIVLYSWNVDYPADMYFDINLKEWKLESEYEFEGFSHEKITRKIYIRGN
jgi:hypothetical protein